MVDQTPAYLQSEINRLDQQIKSAQASLCDPQLKSLAKEEIQKLLKQKQALLDTVKLQKEPLTAPTNPLLRQGNCVLEIRAAAGGEEAKLWADDLLEMYVRFAETQGFKVLPLGEDVIKLQGKNAYPLLQFESGVHRVQRVPTTESHGRIHTSTATVAVLPEIKEQEIKINPQDISIEFYRSSGSGGQNVNKVSTAVRLKHLPTGIVIESQSQRYQEQNRKIALDILRSKLWELEEQKRLEKLDDARQAIGRGMRAEKIRTYNFPQNRVTDHRINKSWKNLDQILAGNLLPVIKALK